MLAIVGATCSGKNWFAGKLCTEYGWERVVTCTTRPIRSGETNGEDYVFMDDYNFDYLAKQGKLINVREYDTSEGIWKYGIRPEDIDMSKKKRLIIIDPLGATRLFKPWHVAMLVVPRDVRKLRAFCRGDNEAEFARRDHADQHDIALMIDFYQRYYSEFPQIITNKFQEVQPK